MDSLDQDRQLKLWASLIPEHGFSQAFVLTDEQLSFQLMCELGLYKQREVLEAHEEHQGSQGAR